MTSHTIQSYNTGLIQVVITSFGYLHGQPPEADITMDVRSIARDPHVSPEMRWLTGLEPVVVRSVFAHPEASLLVSQLCLLVVTYVAAKEASGQLVRVAIGCAGGRHRSVAIANKLCTRLISGGFGADVEHRDILRPVVTR